MLQVMNPATGEVVRELLEDDAASIERKARAARTAQPAWARTPFAERLAAIGRFGELIAARRESLAALLTSEVGKPIRQARNELSAMPGRLSFFMANTAAAMADEVVLRDPGPPSIEERISHEPLGVIANISAWNYPWFVGSNVFVPALLTGNAVVYKPSEHAALTGLAIADLLHEAGVPRDVFAAVIGGGPAGASLLEQPLEAVFFTGSYETGKRVAAAAAARLMRIQLELGGKDPAYVCDDVDVEATARALADGAFYNNGQSCCAVERIYVHRRIAPQFIEAFVAEVRGFVMGDPREETTYIGPLARREQIAVLESQVDDALTHGARLLLGGSRAPGAGWYFTPTVLAGVNRRMKVMREESFGPIIGIQEVSDDEDATALMNDTDYGLTASVYTPDRTRAERILAHLDTGTVYWNCCDRVSPRLPWSGRKHSGVGATLSLAGIRAFVQPRAWHMVGQG